MTPLHTLGWKMNCCHLCGVVDICWSEKLYLLFNISKRVYSLFFNYLYLQFLFNFFLIFFYFKFIFINYFILFFLWSYCSFKRTSWYLVCVSFNKNLFLLSYNLIILFFKTKLLNLESWIWWVKLLSLNWFNILQSQY
jgi:hypothetical protein